MAMSPCATMLGSEGKWRNLQKRRLADFVAARRSAALAVGRKLDAVFHMGAISETTATDGDLVMDTNFRLSLRLLDWCAETRHAVHLCLLGCDLWRRRGGLCRRQFDRRADAAQADESLWLEQASVRSRGDRTGAQRRKLPPQWAGLKFFNVFGPNEYHKGEMMSLVAKRFARRQGGQAGAAVQVAPRWHRRRRAAARFHLCGRRRRGDEWLLEHPRVSGIFNVGTGVASSFRDMITALFAALGRGPNIEYVDMPAAIRDSYQYFTQASVDHLRQAGYSAPFTPIEAAVKTYVTAYLDRPDRYR